jgi:hypothetical protein
MQNGIKPGQQVGSTENGIERWGMLRCIVWVGTGLVSGVSEGVATSRDSGQGNNPRKKARMKRKTRALGLIFLVHISLSSLEAAYGQSYDANGTTSVSGGAYGLSYGNGLSGGGGGLSGGGSVSDPITAFTAASYNGMANLVRFEGQYALDTSKASINFEQARTLYLENQRRMLEIRRSEYWASAAAKAQDIEDRHLAQLRSKELLDANRPLPSPSSDLDPITGRIHWPSTLMAMDFDNARKELDSLFDTRAKTGSPVAEVSNHIKVTVREMKQLLHESVLKIPLEDYSEARQFLDQLVASAQLKQRRIDVRSAKKTSDDGRIRVVVGE